MAAVTMTATYEVGCFRITGTETDGVLRAVRGVEGCDYPWDRLRPALAEHGVEAIPVTFEKPENGNWRAYYAGPKKGIFIYPDISGLEGLMIHEAAHAVDGLTLTDAARDELHRLMHGGTDHLPADCVEWNVGKGAAHEYRAAEGFAWLFVYVFARQFHGTPVYGGHRVDDVAGFRRIVLDHLPKEPVVPTFPDVPEDRWSHPSVEKATAAGVLEGGDDGRFRPAEPVTREQLAVILDRLGLLEVSQ